MCFCDFKQGSQLTFVLTVPVPPRSAKWTVANITWPVPKCQILCWHSDMGLGLTLFKWSIQSWGSNQCLNFQCEYIHNRTPLILSPSIYTAKCERSNAGVPDPWVGGWLRWMTTHQHEDLLSSLSPILLPSCWITTSFYTCNVHSWTSWLVNSGRMFASKC